MLYSACIGPRGQAGEKLGVLVPTNNRHGYESCGSVVHGPANSACQGASSRAVEGLHQLTRVT
jgi:hypothetical protein